MTQQIQRRILNEWLRERHPLELATRDVRLGPSPVPDAKPGQPTIEEKYAKSGRRFIDCVIIRDDEVLFIEADVVATPKTVGALENYVRLFSQTPELTKHQGKKLRPILLAALIPEDVRAMAKDKGYEYEEYRPAWVNQFVLRT